MVRVMTMPRSREEEAGVLYIEGFKAVRAGGHELSMLSGHLHHMLRGTSSYLGALWQVRRVPPEGLLVELESFSDYLLKPPRKGLGLPSLHFLRQTLNATTDGQETLVLVREQFAHEWLDFDALADRERDTTLLKRQPGSHGGDRTSSTKLVLELSKGGTDRQAAQLAKRRPDLADQVRAGEMKLATALVEAGIRKTYTPLEQIQKLWPKLTPAECAQVRRWPNPKTTRRK
jgi:hypothetical protein